MGYIYEELLRRFSEQSGEEAGDHFTPREVIRLMSGDLLYNRTNSPDQVGKAAVFRKTKIEAITFAS